MLMASSSYNQISSSSPWDVFLSFRGTDTRYTFTSHLYNALHRIGIRIYMDDPELRSGQVISDSLIQAIHESKTCIVVFSENYASSRWCLDELVEIYDCYTSVGGLVIPVFYKIDPSVVRHQTGSFEEAFEKHETQFKGEMEKLNKWRDALEKVADFSGKHVGAQRSEADIINEIVDEILLEINPKTLHVAQYPVGLDSRVEDIKTLLISDTESVRRIGIHGMGGVGKTTLAKAVYNNIYHLFRGSCFLANVRETSVTERGQICLQQQLINDVLRCKNTIVTNVDQGIELIRARICSIKVLIVIDDLDDPTVLEYIGKPFALGSLIIITTRNEDLLESIKVDAKYKLNELSDHESRQLFSQHAFGVDKIPEEFMKLSEEILEFAGGLPLALKVFGSNLVNLSERGWRWYIDKMKRVSVDKVEKNLVISFKALELDYLRDIFLDIACFFIGRDEEEVVQIMETCYTLVNYNIDILKKRNLLLIDSENKLLGMHNLLRHMGRKIACNNSPRDPGKHSRLWASEDIRDVLKKQKGTEAIEGVIPQNLSYPNALKGASFHTKTFIKMSNLRFLYLDNMNLTGSFEQTLEDLRWLRWYRCPLKCFPSSFYPQKLVVLELPHSHMRTMWELNVIPQVFENLKTLNMSYSLYMTKTPDFTLLPCLETLNLECCKSLEEVHVSIGSLERLVFLNLSGCVSLTSLPDTICNLGSLESLNIFDCTSLQELPIELGNMECLKELNSKGLTIFKLPGSIGRLSKLVELKLCNNKNLKTLPDTISKLRSLETLDLSRCSNLLSIAKLPAHLKEIIVEGCTSMKDLNLTGCCCLREIRGLEKLTSITKLHMGGCNSSLLNYTFTQCFFQIYSGFGHEIIIYEAEFPDWIDKSSRMGSTMALDLQPNVSQNFLGMILCFKYNEDEELHRLDCSVRTTTSEFIWSNNQLDTHSGSLMVIVPRSIFTVRDRDGMIEFTSNAAILGIHLMYQTENTTDEYYIIAVDAEERTDYPSKRLKHIESDRLVIEGSHSFSTY